MNADLHAGNPSTFRVGDRELDSNRLTGRIRHGADQDDCSLALGPRVADRQDRNRVADLKRGKKMEGGVDHDFKGVQSDHGDHVFAFVDDLTDLLMKRRDVTGEGGTNRELLEQEPLAVILANGLFVFKLGQLEFETDNRDRGLRVGQLTCGGTVSATQLRETLDVSFGPLHPGPDQVDAQPRLRGCVSDLRSHALNAIVECDKELAFPNVLALDDGDPGNAARHHGTERGRPVGCRHAG